jgi:hypothetical protein
MWLPVCPESIPRVTPMTAFRHDVSGAVEAYAAYLNAPRGFLDDEEQQLFDEEMARARAAMESAWLEATPVQEIAPPPAAPGPSGSWLLALRTAVRRVARRAFARARGRTRRAPYC